MTFFKKCFVLTLIKVLQIDIKKKVFCFDIFMPANQKSPSLKYQDVDLLANQKPLPVHSNKGFCHIHMWMPWSKYFSFFTFFTFRMSPDLTHCIGAAFNIQNLERNCSGLMVSRKLQRMLSKVMFCYFQVETRLVFDLFWVDCTSPMKYWMIPENKYFDFFVTFSASLCLI